MDAAAIAAIATSGTIGVLGLIFAAWTSYSERRLRAEIAKADRAHERRLAADARLFDLRRVVYEELLIFVFRWQIAIERRSPLNESRQPPLELPPESDFWRLRGRVAAFASSDVATMLDRYNACAERFTVAGRDYKACASEETRDRAQQLAKDRADLYWQLEARAREDLTE